MTRVGKKFKTIPIFFHILVPLFLSFSLCAHQDNAAKRVAHNPPDTGKNNAPIIANIYVIGNEQIPTDIIKRKIPYVEGDIFNPALSNVLIKNLNELNRFANIELKAHTTSPNRIDLYIIVREKKRLESVTFNGNYQLSTSDIKKKVKVAEMPSLEKEELEKFAAEIKALYREKNYLEAEIIPELIVNGDVTQAVFTIKEHGRSLVKKVRFEGNKNISGKQLRSVIFTREDWLFGFTDRAGTYSPERLDADRHIIEQFYQNNGYLTARVVDAQVEVDPRSKDLAITFYIQEGPIYTIKEVHAPGNDLLSEEFLLPRIPIWPGMIYSRDSIVESIKNLELIWGEFGYINASVEPMVQPDEEEKTVSVTFNSELSSKVYLNRLNIIGNKKTLDKVIRRKIALEEGELITTRRMEESKNRVESMGYFDLKEGVNWKINRLAENMADLDLLLKETKTGHANLKMGFGGADMRAPGGSFNVGFELNDTNLAGTGISMALNGSMSKDEKTVNFNLTQPWLFDKPITGAIDIFHRRPSYDEFKYTAPVNEINTGGGLALGFITPTLYDSTVLFRGGAENIHYDKAPVVFENVAKTNPLAGTEYQKILDAEFTPGTFGWLAASIGQDFRNHPVHTSRGYKWGAVTRFGIPNNFSARERATIGFYHFDIDWLWFTPLIGEYDLVLRLHAFAGLSKPFKNHVIPYRELFHIGGPSSVRGFLFGEVGPKWQSTPRGGKDSIGGQKSFFINLDLIVPIRPDLSMKGVIFYDGGAGWDNPYVTPANQAFIIDNRFTYRHAVGVGLRISILCLCALIGVTNSIHVKNLANLKAKYIYL